MSARVKGGARAVCDVTEGVVLATVEIAAPPERVFRALTDSNEIVAWWGSDSTYRTTKHTADLRVGGKWRSVGRGVDGSGFAVEGNSSRSTHTARSCRRGRQTGTGATSRRSRTDWSR